MHKFLGHNVCKHAPLLKARNNTELGRHSSAAVMCAAVGPAGDYSNVSGMSFSAVGEALGLDRTSVKAYAERRSLMDSAAHLTAAETLEAQS